ncbi:MAG: VOC family protein [Actinobacteria bacterium]|nr:MAG: VOC family protein [Actinomycetota bacterium]
MGKNTVRAHRIYHVNVNCSDLERSLAFYCDGIGLRKGTRTKPDAPQPGAAFGLEQVQWDAWILHGDHGNEGVVLDLLEWQVPRPQGQPRQRVTDAGFSRLSITVPDLDATYARLVEMHADCWSEPTALDLEVPTKMFIVSDPDGTQIELLEGTSVRLSHVAVNCTDIERSQRFYEDVMGLRTVLDTKSPPLPGNVFRLDGDVRLHARLMRDMSTGFMVELISWITPSVSSWGFRKANDLGIFRMAWLTNDIDSDYQALMRAGACCYSAPAALEMGPGIPTVRALFFDDPDAVCLELIESGAR